VSTVRAAEPADLDAVVTLEARVFADSVEEAWSPRSVEEEFAALGDTRRIVVAVDGSRVVGHAVLMAVGDTGDLTRVAVDGSRRRLGIASRLVESLVGQARALGLGAVLLEVADTNFAAIALYERHGFEVIDRRTAYYKDGSDAVIMRRRLDPADAAGAADLASR
jgi:[ribosomal protein S18]-alanine N-acetyltransferase